MDSAQLYRLANRKMQNDVKQDDRTSQEYDEWKICPEPHVNGWTVIGRALKTRSLHQKDLAACLAVSSAAVSQMKSGRIKLNRRQIARVCAFLALEDEEIRLLYAEIFSARFQTEPLEPRN